MLNTRVCLFGPLFTGVVVAVVPEEIQTVIEGDTFMTCFGVTLPEIAPSTDIILDIVLAPNVTGIAIIYYSSYKQFL